MYCVDPALTPSTSPDVKSNSSMCGLYTLNITRALPVLSAGMMGAVVGVAINAVGCGKNFFLWQVNSGANSHKMCVRAC